MKRLMAALIAGAVACSLSAKTNAERKAELESIAPPNTIVKVAYCKGGGFGEFPHDMSGTSHVYVCSSEDGVIRRVNTVTGGLSMVNITADGKRVIYFNWGSYRAYVVNWDGTNERQITNISNQYLIEYWRNPADGTDWAVVSDPITRINIDNTSQKIVMSPTGRGNGDGGGVTDDGKYILVYDPSFGLQDVTTGAIAWGAGGCMGSVRAGPTNQWSSNGSGHAYRIVCGQDGKEVGRINMASIAGCTSGETGRHSQHPDYFTFMAVSSDRPKANNPVLLRTTDNRFITIEDNAGSAYIGDMDAVFLPKGGVGIRPGSQPIRLMSKLADNPSGTFSISGRQIASASGAVNAIRGVAVVRMADGRPTLTRTVHLQ